MKVYVTVSEAQSLIKSLFSTNKDMLDVEVEIVGFEQATEMTEASKPKRTRTTKTHSVEEVAVEVESAPAAPALNTIKQVAELTEEEEEAVNYLMAKNADKAVTEKETVKAKALNALNTPVKPSIKSIGTPVFTTPVTPSEEVEEDTEEEIPVVQVQQAVVQQEQSPLFGKMKKPKTPLLFS